MVKYLQLFKEFLDSKSIKYEVIDEVSMIIKNRGDKWTDGRFLLTFDSKDRPEVGILGGYITTYNAEKRDAGIKICNSLNAQYRWVKFYVDDSNNVVCEIDAIFEETNLATILTLLIKMINIIDQSYPELMKLAWQ